MLCIKFKIGSLQTGEQQVSQQLFLRLGETARSINKVFISAEIRKLESASMRANQPFHSNHYSWRCFIYHCSVTHNDFRTDFSQWPSDQCALPLPPLLPPHTLDVHIQQFQADHPKSQSCIQFFFLTYKLLSSRGISEQIISISHRNMRSLLKNDFSRVFLVKRGKAAH